MGATFLIARRVAAVWLALAHCPLAGGSPVVAETVGAGRFPVADDQTVVAVELRSDAPLARPGAAWELIAVETGQTLGGDAVRRSLRNLQASGFAGEVEAYVHEVAGGVVVTFVIWGNIRVDEVRLEGELGLKERDLRKVVVQKTSQPLIEDRVIRSVYRLQDLYRSKGYFEASVRVDVDVDEARKRAEITLLLASGPRAVVSEVAFDGELRELGREQLIERLQAGPGRRYSSQAVRNDVERLQSWLVNQGYRLAAVERPQEEYYPEDDAIRLIYPLRIGPRVEVEIVGAEVDELRKKGLLPFLGDEGYDEALVLQAVQLLRTHYQQKGHYRVGIEWREERSEERVHLRLEIEPGPTFMVEELRFTGNNSLSRERLIALMNTSTRRVLAPGSGRLVDEVLEADLDNIRSYYALAGFLGTRVGPEQVEEEGDQLLVTVPIEEGTRRQVVDLDFEGVDNLDPAELRAGLPLEPGGPFHPRRLEETLDLVRARYEERGYDSAQVSARQTWNDERTLADVTIQVLEGPQAVIDRVVVRGNQRTLPEVIRRQASLRPGQPVSTRRLLEAQRSLYGLGIFSQVDVEMVAGAPFSSQRNVVVRVEEARNHRLTYGVGYDSEDGIRGLIGYSHVNLLGRAIAGQVDTRVSERDSLLRGLVRQPNFFGWPVSMTYSLFRVEEQRESFDSKRRGTQVEAVRLLDDLRLGLLYTYKIVEVSDLAEPIGEIEIDRELQEVELSSITPNLFWDQRDDPLDPRRGWSSRLQLEYAFPFLAADTRFAKLFAQQTAYINLGRLGVAAGSIRVGAIEPVGTDGFVDTTLPEDLASREIPISERFFAGGRASHRAYERDTLGIPGETIIDGAEVGGNGLLLINLDYRFPIAGPFGGTVFFDTGNVWADWRNIDASEFKGGVGVGARYLSPIGPLRLDLGWKLDREEDEDSLVIFFSFGNPF